MAPWVRPPPTALSWLARLGLLSGRWLRTTYMQRPLEWVVDPNKALTEEERLAVKRTDLWTLMPGSYEPHNIGLKRILVLRTRRHLERDFVMVCTYRGMFEQADFLTEDFRDKQQYRVVGRYLRKFSSPVPGKVLDVPEQEEEIGNMEIPDVSTLKPYSTVSRSVLQNPETF